MTKKVARKARKVSRIRSAGKRTSKSKTAKKNAAEGGGRKGIWKGNLSFGLVNIPIHLESAQEEQKLSFHLLDKRDHARVGYKQINKKTGKEISRKDVIKGFEVSKGKFILLTPADFDKANVKATSTIDIEDFVDMAEVDPMLFERPYYVVPGKGGEKAYVLLRDVLLRTQKAAIAKVVLHTVQRLVMLFVREDYIVLEILRFANEVKEAHEIEPLSNRISHAKISEREMKVAEDLVKGMTSPWHPDKYKNTYRDDLMKMINARKGKTVKQAETPAELPPAEETDSNVIDLTALLKRSIGAAAGGAARKRS